jgi:hypothetical protein
MPCFHRIWRPWLILYDTGDIIEDDGFERRHNALKFHCHGLGFMYKAELSESSHCHRPEYCAPSGDQKDLVCMAQFTYAPLPFGASAKSKVENLNPNPNALKRQVSMSVDLERTSRVV